MKSKAQESHNQCFWSAFIWVPRQNFLDVRSVQSHIQQGAVPEWQ